jgi:hypothetical protein
MLGAVVARPHDAKTPTGGRQPFGPPDAEGDKQAAQERGRRE